MKEIYSFTVRGLIRRPFILSIQSSVGRAILPLMPLRSGPFLFLSVSRSLSPLVCSWITSLSASVCLHMSVFSLCSHGIFLLYVSAFSYKDTSHVASRNTLMILSQIYFIWKDPISKLRSHS